MFKRVEKRRQKQKEDEELGIDDEMKDVLGIQDSDSDSDSDSDDSSDEDSESSGSEESAEEEAGHDGKDDDNGEDGSESEAEDATAKDVPEIPPITVAEALENPIYPTTDDGNACIICPQKVLKNKKMVDVHRASNGHARRLGRFIKLAKGVPTTNLAIDVVRSYEPPVYSEAIAASKRLEKRKAKQAAMIIKREKRKAMKLKVLERRLARDAAREAGKEGGKKSKKKAALDDTEKADTTVIVEDGDNAVKEKTKKRKHADLDDAAPISEPKKKKSKQTAASTADAPTSTPSKPKRVKDKRKNADGTRLVGRMKPAGASDTAPPPTKKAKNKAKYNANMARYKKNK